MADSQTTSPQPLHTSLYVDVRRDQWPIIYSPHYNIYLLGIQHLVSFHGFDVGKWGRVYNYLKDDKMFREEETIVPLEAEHEDLAFVHEEGYLQALKMSRYVAGILEFLPVALIPNGMVQSKILTPFRLQTGGTILGAKLAMERGWAINIGGGFHHSRHNQGAGFCVYADITLAIRFLQTTYQQQNAELKAMIVDLDAHQGNGHERDFMKDDNVYIYDVYNADIYPNDKWAKRAINKMVEVHSGIGDEEYLDKVKIHLEEALMDFSPDLVVYNAGTDIMAGDPLGRMNISDKGIIERDEIVFKRCRENSPPIPVVMVTSGGYQSTTARVIADSIQNLLKKSLITPPGQEPPPKTQSSGRESSSSVRSSAGASSVKEGCGVIGEAPGAGAGCGQAQPSSVPMETDTQPQDCDMPPVHSAPLEAPGGQSVTMGSSTAEGGKEGEESLVPDTGAPLPLSETPSGQV